MKLLKRSKRMFEPPAILLTDLAFNLVIFFVVCASMEPTSGRRQDIPRGSKDATASPQSAQNVEILLSRTAIKINGTPTSIAELPGRLRPLLEGKTKVEERMVVVKTEAPKDTPYQKWIRVTAMIEQAGGVVALQIEESREVVVP
jgi:biopolymer transport protein ExbD